MAGGAAPAAGGSSKEKKEKPAQEKKEKKEGTKAERRAAARAASGQPPATTPTGPPAGQATRPSHSQQQQQQQPAASASTTTPASAAGEDPSTTSAATATAPDPLQLFLHLDTPSSSRSLSHSSKYSTSNIHPSIIKLALQYAEFKIVGANARCIALVEALKDVITSYTPPPQTSLTRHLPTTHLNPQISHLVRARPMSVSMGTAIRYLKYEISLIDIEMPVDQAKSHLLMRLSSFLRDRILLPGRVIASHTTSKIRDQGDVILTYGKSSLVELALVEAWKAGKRFSVVVVDAGPLFEGRNLLPSLQSLSIPTTYILLSALATVLPRITLSLLGVASVLSNGAPFARAGTAMVALMMKEKGVPVVVLCETYKFSERIMLDSIVGNQMGETASLLPPLPPTTSTANPPTPASAPTPAPALPTPLSLLYDVARPEDVTVVITEAGLIPAQSVPIVLRDYKPLVQGA
ncbi:nagb/rpia/CoA transferase-like protein [Meredithblackwellia eburnea MCA 4105]